MTPRFSLIFIALIFLIGTPVFPSSEWPPASGTIREVYFRLVGCGQSGEEERRKIWEFVLSHIPELQDVLRGALRKEDEMAFHNGINYLSAAFNVGKISRQEFFSYLIEDLERMQTSFSKPVPEDDHFECRSENRQMMRRTAILPIVSFGQALIPNAYLTSLSDHLEFFEAFLACVGSSSLNLQPELFGKVRGIHEGLKSACPKIVSEKAKFQNPEFRRQFQEKTLLPVLEGIDQLLIELNDVPDSKFSSSVRLACELFWKIIAQRMIYESSEFAKWGDPASIFSSRIYDTWRSSPTFPQNPVLYDPDSGAIEALCRFPDFKIARNLTAWGRDLMAEAIAKCGTETVGLLLDHGERLIPNALNQATAYGRKEMLKFLLSKGADIENRDVNGNTPLYSTIGIHSTDSRLDMAEILLAHGARVNPYGWCRRTPLHYAVWELDQAGVTFLVEHGALLEAQDRDGRTPVFLAVERYNM